jgi:uncharacterized delta-60 repeat protein
MKRHIHLATAAVALALITAALPAAAAAAPGDLDPTFGSGGKVTTDVGGSDGAQAVAIQGDGKVVAAGLGNFAGPGTGDFALARYNPDGSLDTSFGSGGKVTTDFGGFDAASAVAIQPDGKIIAAGRSGSGDFALARYNPDGSLDSSFGSGGKVTTDFGGFDSAFGVALQADGKIVAAGQGASSGDFALARYNPDGSLDPTFGSGGKVTTDFAPFEAATAVTIQADGKIVTTGSTSSGDFALLRYKPDGSLDTSFGSGGIVSTTFGFASAFGGALALQPDGKIIAAGRAGTDFLLARFNPADGSLDSSFGSGGIATTSFGGAVFDAAFGVVLQPNGKIVAAGGTFNSFSPPAADFALARYMPDGSLDSSFGSGGTLTTDFGGFDIGFGVALQADGKIVAAGQGGSGSDFALARYLGDPTFIAVSIDIKPGEFPNPINPKSNGTIPVAILSSPSFDAPSKVDTTSLKFGRTGNESSLAFCSAPEDVNGDGRPDVICHFTTQKTGFQTGDTQGTLMGKTVAGIPLRGSDSVVIVPSK